MIDWKNQATIGAMVAGMKALNSSPVLRTERASSAGREFRSEMKFRAITVMATESTVETMPAFAMLRKTRGERSVLSCGRTRVDFIRMVRQCFLDRRRNLEAETLRFLEPRPEG